MFCQFFKYFFYKNTIKISIEGNIGCGKSRLINYFQKKYSDNDIFFNGKNVKFLFISEPVDEWRNFDGLNLLNLMYQNPTKWSFSFYSLVFVSLFKNQVKLNLFSKNDDNLYIGITERSIYSSKYCFLKNIYNM